MSEVSKKIKKVATTKSESVNASVADSKFFSASTPIVDLSTPAKRLMHLSRHGLAHIVNTNNVTSISPHPITVTPEMANAFIQHNTTNRDMNTSNKNKIKACLLRGCWDLTADALTFDFDGVLTNGQNRLRAIIESGVAATLIVGFGIKQSREMDTGTKRTAWDVIRMSNLGDAVTQNKKIVGTVRAMLRRHIRGGGSATNSETIEAYEKWQQYLIPIAPIITSYRTGDVWVNAALVAAYMNGISLADIEEFKREYAAESSQAPQHKIILDLRMQNRIQCGGGDTNYTAKYRSTQFALNEFVNRTGCTTVPFGLTSDIWDYSTLWLNEDKNNNTVNNRYFA